MLLIVYIVMMLIGIPYKLCSATYTTLRRYFRKDNGVQEENVVFVGGLGSYSPSECLGFRYWGFTHNKIQWIPKVGPFSSIDDRARELFYDLVNSDFIIYNETHTDHARIKKSYNTNPNIPGRVILKDNHKEKITLFGHSCGGSTIDRMLYLLEKHHKYLVQEGLVEHHTFRDDVVAENVFPKELRYKKPWIRISLEIPTYTSKHSYMLTPQVFKRVVYISVPFGGVTWYNLGYKPCMKPIMFSRSWLGMQILGVYDKISHLVGRIIFNTYLCQFQSSSFLNTHDTIMWDMVPKHSERNTRRGAKVIKSYGIDKVKFISSSSVKVGWLNHQLSYFSTPVLHLFFFLRFNSEIGPHDGVLSVESQMTNHTCLCIKEEINDMIDVCHKCHTYYTKYDHFQTLGTFDHLPGLFGLYRKLLR